MPNPNQLAMRCAYRFVSLLMASLLAMQLPCVLAAQANMQPQLERSDFTWRGFVTVNYEISDNAVAYDRLVDRNGTLKATSILGLQGTYAFSPATTAVAQLAVSRRTEEDSSLRPSVRWAYLSHTFNNGYNLRLGRQRFNVYRNSENLEIGSTYTLATLPDEVYVNPDFLSGDGISVRKQHFYDDGRTLEWGIVAAKRSLDVPESARAQLQTNANSSDINVVNAYAEYAFSLNSSIFASHLEFETELDTANGNLESNGGISSLAFAHQAGGYSYLLEQTILNIRNKLLLNSGGQANLGSLRSTGYAITVEKDMQRFRPYINYGRYLQSSSGQGELWSARVGLAFKHNRDTTYKAELRYIDTGHNPGNAYFDAPVGSSHTANILTLSYNRVF